MNAAPPGAAPTAAAATMPDSKATGTPTEAMRLAAGAGNSLDPNAPRIEVIKAADQYESTRKSAYFPTKDAAGLPHFMGGRPAIYDNRHLDEPTSATRRSPQPG